MGCSFSSFFLIKKKDEAYGDIEGLIYLLFQLFVDPNVQGGIVFTSHGVDFAIDGVGSSRFESDGVINKCVMVGIGEILLR